MSDQWCEDHGVYESGLCEVRRLRLLWGEVDEGAKLAAEARVAALLADTEEKPPLDDDCRGNRLDRVVGEQEQPEEKS